MPKKISIDELAVMVRDGFESVETRFDSVDKRLAAVEKRINTVNQDLSKQISELAMDAKKHRELTSEIDHRLRRIEQELDIARKQATLTDARVSHLESALSRR